MYIYIYERTDLVCVVFLVRVIISREEHVLRALFTFSNMRVTTAPLVIHNKKFVFSGFVCDCVIFQRLS